MHYEIARFHLSSGTFQIWKYSQNVHYAVETQYIVVQTLVNIFDDFESENISRQFALDFLNSTA